VKTSIKPFRFLILEDVLQLVGHLNLLSNPVPGRVEGLIIYESQYALVGQQFLQQLFPRFRAELLRFAFMDILLLFGGDDCFADVLHQFAYDLFQF
jgi:hypothetical protein